MRPATGQGREQRAAATGTGTSAYAKRPPRQDAVIGSRFGAAKPPTPQSLRRAARHISMINVSRELPRLSAEYSWIAGRLTAWLAGGLAGTAIALGLRYIG